MDLAYKNASSKQISSLYDKYHANYDRLYILYTM